MNKTTLINIGLVAFVILFAVVILSLKGGPDIDLDLVECISNSSILYTQTGCHACENQLNIFGEHKELINEVNCFEDTLTCTNKSIDRTPTWEIKGQFYKGTKTLDELKELTGCGYQSKITGVIK